MTKVLVAFDTKYGNTKIVAEKIAEGMKEVEGIEVTVSNMKKVDLKTIEQYDAILMGCPNHFGGPTRTAKKFIDKLGKLDLKGKVIAVFDTYIKEDFEKAVKKMEEKINEKIPGSKLMTPGLSIKVEEMKGPILEEEFPKTKELGKQIATQIKG
ncbi:flavodoxin family protein [Candidatus Borrarchaeum sp.]|uniref:flavodoxin family protein n=1 Tax=Candidatus Borrarchaeum sp. TaxID=2846742 RepID=UPI002580A3CB|nr:flavodoxin family protein [Candidatus Borrarchaeum sp.]